MGGCGQIKVLKMVGWEWDDFEGREMSNHIHNISNIEYSFK